MPDTYKADRPGSGSGRRSKTYEVGRVCPHPGCGTRLSIYNPDDACASHRGPQTVRTRGQHSR